MTYFFYTKFEKTSERFTFIAFFFSVMFGFQFITLQVINKHQYSINKKRKT